MQCNSFWLALGFGRLLSMIILLLFFCVCIASVTINAEYSNIGCRFQDLTTKCVCICVCRITHFEILGIKLITNQILVIFFMLSVAKGTISSLLLLLLAAG